MGQMGRKDLPIRRQQPACAEFCSRLGHIGGTHVVADRPSHRTCLGQDAVGVIQDDAAELEACLRERLPGILAKGRLSQSGA